MNVEDVIYITLTLQTINGIGCGGGAVCLAFALALQAESWVF